MTVAALGRVINNKFFFGLAITNGELPCKESQFTILNHECRAQNSWGFVILPEQQQSRVAGRRQWTSESRKEWRELVAAMQSITCAVR